MADSAKLEEDPNAEKCQNCHTPCHEEETCYFGAKMGNFPPNWKLTKVQKKGIEAFKQARKPIKHEIE